jgi:chemosensory pili system protein ChpC
MTPAHPDPGEILCVMIPIAGGPLLLPNVAVAEVVPMGRLAAREDLPAWCPGTLAWRGIEVPVIRFAVLNGREAGTARESRCIAVLNRVRQRDGLPFYGVMADGLPRLVHLAAADIENHKSVLGPAELAAVRVGTELAAIPNLTYVESSLAALRAAR